MRKSWEATHPAWVASTSARGVFTPQWLAVGRTRALVSASSLGELPTIKKTCHKDSQQCQKDSLAGRMFFSFLHSIKILIFFFLFISQTFPIFPPLSCPINLPFFSPSSLRNPLPAHWPLSHHSFSYASAVVTWDKSFCSVPVAVLLTDPQLLYLFFNWLSCFQPAYFFFFWTLKTVQLDLFHY